MMFADVVQRVYDADGTFRPELAMRTLSSEPKWWVKAGAPLSSGRYASRDEVVALFDKLLSAGEAACAVPLWESAEVPRWPRKELRNGRGLEYGLPSREPRGTLPPSVR